MKPTIRDLRIERNMGQAALASEAKIGVTTLVHLEAGKPVQKRIAEKVCLALGVTLDAVSINIYSPVQTMARARQRKTNQ